MEKREAALAKVQEAEAGLKEAQVLNPKPKNPKPGGGGRPQGGAGGSKLQNPKPPSKNTGAKYFLGLQ